MTRVNTNLPQDVASDVLMQTNPSQPPEVEAQLRLQVRQERQPLLLRPHAVVAEGEAGDVDADAVVVVVVVATEEDPGRTSCQTTAMRRRIGL